MLFDKLKAWQNKRLEEKLTTPRKVDTENKEDYYYPPPSAYEVKQINEELGKHYHAVSKAPK